MMIFFAIIGFLFGGIPFSLILTKIFAHRDVRTVGDGNPGGTNALKAGGMKIGIPAIILDIVKGFLPVYLARQYGVSGWELIPVCIAPALGHAFSPFLKFHGGKALGATGGTWVALIGLWAFPVYAAFALPFAIIQTVDGWSAVAGMFSLIGYSILWGEPWMIVFSILNTALILFTHHQAIAVRPQPRTWVLHLFKKGEA